MKKNWKTTLSGSIAATGAILLTQDGVIKWYGAAMHVLGLFGLAWFSKDNNVTGGTTKQ
jgi:hypothetical protein